MAKSNRIGKKELKKDKKKAFRKPLERDPLVGKRLAKLRRSLGITQREFGDLIKMPSTSISAYERNLKSPLLNVLARIQGCFNANITWIVSGKGSMFVEAPPKLSSKSLVEFDDFEVGATEASKISNLSPSTGAGNGGQVSSFSLHPTMAISTQALICIHCDFGVIDQEGTGHRFCPQCSAPLISNCHGCGEKIAFSSAKFCSFCQISFKQSSL